MSNLEAKFIQVPQAIINKFDLITASLFGLIWSKEQLSKNFCYASQNSLATELGIHKNTVGKKLKLLLESGLVEDITGTPFNHSGATRKYITNLNVLNKLETIRKADAKRKKDSDTLGVVLNQSDTLNVRSDTFSVQSDTSSVPSDTFKVQSDTLGVDKIYREIYRDIYREIDRENIEENSSFSSDDKKENQKPILPLATIEKVNELLNQGYDLQRKLEYEDGLYDIDIYDLEKIDPQKIERFIEAIDKHYTNKPEYENDFPF